MERGFPSNDYNTTTGLSTGYFAIAPAKSIVTMEFVFSFRSADEQPCASGQPTGITIASAPGKTTIQRDGSQSVVNSLPFLLTRPCRRRQRIHQTSTTGPPHLTGANKTRLNRLLLNLLTRTNSNNVIYIDERRPLLRATRLISLYLFPSGMTFMFRLRLRLLHRRIFRYQTYQIGENRNNMTRLKALRRLTGTRTNNRQNNTMNNRRHVRLLHQKRRHNLRPNSLNLTYLATNIGPHPPNVVRRASLPTRQHGATVNIVLPRNGTMLTTTNRRTVKINATLNRRIISRHTGVTKYPIRRGKNLPPCFTNHVSANRRALYNNLLMTKTTIRLPNPVRTKSISGFRNNHRLRQIGAVMLSNVDQARRLCINRAKGNTRGNRLRVRQRAKTRPLRVRLFYINTAKLGGRLVPFLINGTSSFIFGTKTVPKTSALGFSTVRQ